MSEQSLKRYAADIEMMFDECDSGEWVAYSDVRTLIHPLHAIESARGCDAGCVTRIARTTDRSGRPVGGFGSTNCDCNHGRMMAVLQGARS